MSLRLEITDGTGCRLEDIPEVEELVIGRGATAAIAIQDAQCSREQLRLRRNNGCWVVEPVSQQVPTYRGQEPVRQKLLVVDGLQLNAGRTIFRFHLPKPSPSAGDDVPPAGDSHPDEHTMLGPPVSMRSASGLPVPLRHVLDAEVVIGRGADVGIRLDHVQVSRHHAKISRKDGRTILRDLGSANGTFVDGKRVVMPTLLAPGTRIGIGPFAVAYTGSELVAASQSEQLQLEGRQLSRSVPGTSGSPPRKILDDVTVVIRPREFVCILGPSGSGKTTLLNALSARAPATTGQVLLNRQPLYQNFDALKRNIAVVPQVDLLHEGLTVEQALGYTARLRLPPDTSAGEIRQRIKELLTGVGLYEQRHTLLRRLSGGQRRRASLVNELLSNPSLLFLDEVTSGLDEQTDRGMMRLFRQFAEQGKTVVCVTHSLANIAETAHLVILLTVGGKLAFMGTPREALEYFQIDRLGDVYEKLEHADRAELWRRQFLESDLAARYVTSRLSPGQISVPSAPRLAAQRTWRRGLRRLVEQWPTLVARYGRLLAEDQRALLGLGLQVLVVAAVVYLVFGNVSSLGGEPFRQASLSCHILFVLGVSSFWFGCNNSAKEIVKERGIYSKELQVNLDCTSYYASKYVLQFILAACQSLLLWWCVSWLCGLPGDSEEQAILMAASAGAGVALGLFLSAISKTEEVALTLVPLVLIPQIILCDIFVKLAGLSSWFGKLFVSNYWAYGALRGTLPNDLVAQLHDPLVPPYSIGSAMVMLGLQTTLLAIASVLVLHLRDRILAYSDKSLWQYLRESL